MGGGFSHFARKDNPKPHNCPCLEAGADPNPRDGKGITPLLADVMIQRDGPQGLDIMKMLLSRGADPLLATHEEITPIYDAAVKGDTDRIDLIVSAVPVALNWGHGVQGTTALGVAVASGVLSLRDRERTVGHLLSLGATDKAVPIAKASALVRAVRRNDQVYVAFWVRFSALVL